MLVPLSEMNTSRLARRRRLLVEACFIPRLASSSQKSARIVQRRSRKHTADVHIIIDEIT
jgi:hypothetical protein